VYPPGDLESFLISPDNSTEDSMVTGLYFSVRGKTHCIVPVESLSVRKI